MNAGRYTYSETVIELQRKDKNGVWSERLDKRLDGPSWFKAESGEKLPGELDSVITPEGWQWLSNWKYTRTGETDLEGWMELDTLIENFSNGPVKYPFIKNRPLRKRQWVRTREKVQLKAVAEPEPPVDNSNPFFASSSSQSSGDRNRGGDSASNSHSYTQLLEHISRSLKKLSDDVKKIELKSKLIGTGRDTLELRLLLRSAIPGVERDINRINLQLQRLDSLESEYISSGNTRNQSTLRVSRKKLKGDLERQKSRFKSISKLAVEKDRQIKTPAERKNQFNSATTSEFAQEDEDTEEAKLFLSKLRVVNEVEINHEILKEKEQAVLAMNREIHEVNEVMNDLATLVKDQDDGVQQIGTNVEGAHMKTTEAYEELKKAEELQKKGGCILS